MQVRNPIDELHSSRLYIYLSRKNEEYARRITTFVNLIAPVLSTTSCYFPYYTRHDAHHGFRVTERIAQILNDECLKLSHKTSLLASETFLLIAAAYAHDLGMTIFPNEEGILLEELNLNKHENWETNSKLQQYLRENHSKRGGKYIQDNANILEVPQNLVGPLDWIMKSHNSSIPDLDQQLQKPFAAEERTIDVKQLSVILCIADAIEFSDTRVVDGVFDLLKIDNSLQARISHQENMKHVCIGDSLSVGSDGRVIVSGTFNDPDVLSLAHHTFDKMEEWIKGYCDIDRRSEIRRLKISAEPFSRNLELFGARFERLGIRINKKNVIDLIASNAVWRQNLSSSIRELIQNSIEACRFRAYHSSQAQNYAPWVRVIFDRSAHTITVLDNGCGMSEHVVLNNFLTVGNSRSRESAYSSDDYAPIARFGIGFWSVFTIANKAEINTAAFEDISRSQYPNNQNIQGITFEVSLEELKDYTVFLPKALPSGASIRLSLKADISIDDIFEQSRHIILSSEIPLTFVFEEKEYPVPMNVPDVLPHDILGARTSLMNECNINIFNWKGASVSGQTELALGLAYRMENGKASFLIDEQSSLQIVTRSLGQIKTSICGFQTYIHPIVLCLDFPRVGALFANHKTPKEFEYSLDRQQLLQNIASENFLKEIRELTHNGYRSFLKHTNSYEPETIFKLNTASAMNGGNAFDQYTGKELEYALEQYPDLLCFRLYVVEKNRDLENSQVLYVNLADLKNLRGTTWILQNHYYFKASHVSSHYSLYPESQQARSIVYEFAKTQLAANPDNDPMYILDANRPSSMLFDSDPRSTVEFFEKKTFTGELLNICIQRVNLSSIKFDHNLHKVLVEIHGRWSGAVYLRNFQTPNKKAYVFLGRYRVLINDSSKLCNYLRDLKNSGRLFKISEIVALLQEDQEGFTSQAIAEYVHV